ncbi:hypothetical protein DRH29_01135 [candidate division Kazan bacterium]|uniref:Baseplate protein J-like domain-containing protein n=1 Tax=candidate division Kazan bacterium TaxID=2202143 RepID=A0A420ZDJ4_UNCK3|nr:MAG: hypothetical protein DRH29_01135 [candidate division Kazan bacterium]
MAEQLIYLEVGDDVAAAIGRLQRASSDEVVMVVPRRALLLQNVINLRMLKRQADLLNKKVSLMTQDEMGRNSASEAGFKILDQLDNDETPAVKPVHLEKTGTTVGSKIRYRKNRPIKADVVSDIDVEPGSLEKTSLDDRGGKWAKVSMGSVVRSAKTAGKLFKLERHHQVLIGFIVLGLLILGSVGFFVIPKAYVAIEVQSEPFSKQFTLVLADTQDVQTAGPNVLTGRFIEVTRENTGEFEATGEENRGEKSEGKITIINHTGSIQGLLVNTRFQSPAGLVFRIKSEILIPPARGGTPGRATVEAVADGGGTKYNISAPMKLTIPGLGDAGVDMVYGEVNGSFKGGTDDITKIVSEEDIEKAKIEAATNVFVSAEAELSRELKRGEKLIPELIQNDVIDTMPSASAGAKRDKFEVRVQSRSWTILIDDEDLKKAISNSAMFGLPEGQQVTDNTIDNASIEVIESNFLNHRINLLIKLEGRVGPSINKQEIASILANQDIESASGTLDSMEEITTSSIEIWPTFLTRIPLLYNNIRIQVIYLGE